LQIPPISRAQFEHNNIFQDFSTSLFACVEENLGFQVDFEPVLGII